MAVPRSVYLFLALGLLAASMSGNIIRLGEAHPVAISAWRLLIASALMAVLARRQLKVLLELTGKEAVLLVLAGVSLALHFFAWIAAVQMTTVANAALFFSINPVITATFGWLIFRERVGRLLVVSIALGLGGVALIGWGDLDLRPEHVLGDISALVCSLLFTAYFLLGKRLRRKLPTRVHVTGVYAVGAVTSFACMLALDLPLVAYSQMTWLCFVLMALVPTMLGHTSMNHALAHLPAGWISAATLSEPLVAGLVAYVAWGETVTWQGVAGYVVICLSVFLVVLDRVRS